VGKPIAAKTLKVMEYIKKHPAAAAIDVAMKFNMHKSQIYQLRKRIKDEQRAEIDDLIGKTLTVSSVDTPAPAPKRLYVPRAAAMIAEKLGIPLEEYVKQMREQDPTAFEETNDLTPEPDEEETTDPWSAKSVDAVLDERAKDYGKFIEGAEIMQMLKRLVHNYIEQRKTTLAFDQREAIDMIIHKLGRIINGNPDKVDHWTDIAGYAKLVADRLEGNVR